MYLIFTGLSIFFAIKGVDINSIEMITSGGVYALAAAIFYLGRPDTTEFKED